MSVINPLGDNIVAQPVEAETKTAAGIILPDNATEKPQTAKVVSVGPEVKGVKKNDEIIYKGFPTDIKLGGEDFLLIKEEDGLATVK